MPPCSCHSSLAASDEPADLWRYCQQVDRVRGGGEQDPPVGPAQWAVWFTFTPMWWSSALNTSGSLASVTETFISPPCMSVCRAKSPHLLYTGMFLDQRSWTRLACSHSSGVNMIFLQMLRLRLSRQPTGHLHTRSEAHRFSSRESGPEAPPTKGNGSPVKPPRPRGASKCGHTCVACYSHIRIHELGAIVHGLEQTLGGVVHVPVLSCFIRHDDCDADPLRAWREAGSHRTIDAKAIWRKLI